MPGPKPFTKEYVEGMNFLERFMIGKYHLSDDEIIKMLRELKEKLIKEQKTS